MPEHVSADKFGFGSLVQLFILKILVKFSRKHIFYFVFSSF